MADDVLDDFLSGFDFGGVDPMQPVTAEEWFMQRMTEGKNSRMHIIRYALMKQLEIRDVFKTKGIMYRREFFEAGKVIHKEISDYEFARIVIEDYISTAYHASLQFAEGENRGKLSMAKVLDLLCAQEMIKSTIENTYSLRGDLTD